MWYFKWQHLNASINPSHYLVTGLRVYPTKTILNTHTGIHIVGTFFEVGENSISKNEDRNPIGEWVYSPIITEASKIKLLWTIQKNGFILKTYVFGNWIDIVSRLCKVSAIRIFKPWDIFTG